jgi:hypothetical protein
VLSLRTQMRFRRRQRCHSKHASLASSSKVSSTPDREDLLLRYLSSKLFMIQVQMISAIARHHPCATFGTTTATYYIKTAAGDVRDAMAMLEDHIAQAARGTAETMTTSVHEPFRSPDSIQ